MKPGGRVGIVDEDDHVRLGGYPGALREVLGISTEEFFPLLEGEATALDDGSRAVGYVLGTADTAGFVRAYREQWVPRLAARYPPPPAEPVTAHEHFLAAHHHPERMLLPELAAHPAHLHIDLLPELQGRLPIRVELKGLTEGDFVAILSDTKASLPLQYKALIATEGVEIRFTEDGIAAVARIAAEVNAEVENIGARRLQTVMEKLLEDVSYNAEDRGGSSVVIDGAYVDSQLKEIARNTDLSRFVL